MGRILRVGLMVLLVAAAGVGNVWGEWVTTTSGNWQYEKIPGTNTCRIKPDGSATIEGTVKIPDEVGSLKVVEIAKEAFKNCTRMTGVTIPNSVTKIGYSAFLGCNNLTAVNIPNGVTEIEVNVFYNCISLKEVTIPSGVTKIGANAFSGCNNLTAVKIPNSVTEIGSSAFSGCKKLTAVNIQNGVTKIDVSAFNDCISLTEVTIPSSMTMIEPGAFLGCSGLKNFKVDESNAAYCAVAGVLFTKTKDKLICCPKGMEGEYVIPDGVTMIGWYAFADCKKLSAVTIPSSVTTISGYAFISCSELTEVPIPSSVKTIGKVAFHGCVGLTEVKIPGGVKNIEQSAFAKCSNLNKVYWFADANCKVADDAFAEIDSPATLYVRKGETEKIKDKLWYKNNFKELAEFYVVTFDAKGGTPTPDAQTVVKDGTATVPTAPTREGYIFDGWQLDGAKYDFGAKVTEDITLVAVWKKKEESTPSTPTDPKTAVESVQLAAVRVVRNPVGEALELEGMERAARVEVYSVVGARVHAEALRGEPRVVIDARGWTSGVYVVKVEASDGAKTLRVVK